MTAFCWLSVLAPAIMRMLCWTMFIVWPSCRKRYRIKFLIVPRLYTNKPRTIGVGYKGMLHQPSPEGEEDMLGGIIAIRKMNVRVVEETGLTGAEEILYPEVFRYLSDLLSYAAVGARSSEDQLHRMIASGVGIPVGMKNPTSGDLSVMLNSVAAAQHEQEFFVPWLGGTHQGQPAGAFHFAWLCRPRSATVSPNYHYEVLKIVIDMYAERQLQNPAIIRGYQPRQFRQKISGANPHCQGYCAFPQAEC